MDQEQPFSYQSFFEQCPIGIVLYDASMRVRACNQAMARILGVAPERIIGLHIDDLRDRRHRRALEEALAGRTVSYESPYHATSSELWFWAAVIFAPYRDATGEITGVMAFITDRTVQMQGEETAPSSLAHLREAQRLGRVGSWTWDIERGVPAASPEFYRIVGLTAIGHAIDPAEFRRFIKVDDRDRVGEQLERALEELRPFITGEFRVIRADGVERVVVMRAEVKYSDTGRPLSAWGTMQDVTERRQIEEQLRRAQQMEALGQLAAGVAHDFNNLITVLRIQSDLLDEALPTHDPLREEVDEIRRAAKRAGNLTSQLLAFGRKQLLRPRTLDLNQLVTETSTMLRRLIGENVELVNTLSAQPLLILADAGQLEQVLVNLAVNARDAMPNGGRLVIATSVATLRNDPVLPTGEYVMLTVSDTGEGMDHTVQQRIFDPFFTTKGPGKGTGLGLSTVLGIVEQSGGRITVDSQPGRGTRFVIALPRAAEASGPDQQSTPLPRERRSRATVLLVEDEAPLRVASHRALERAGYTVLAAEDGLAALALVDSFYGNLDLVVTDMILPGINGQELYARILEKRANVGVLYITGYTDLEMVRRGALEESANLLAKPFGASQLVDAVELALITSQR